MGSFNLDLIPPNVTRVEAVAYKNHAAYVACSSRVDGESIKIKG